MNYRIETSFDITQTTGNMTDLNDYKSLLKAAL
ncbi:hypothetical protein OIU79_021376 [Salix purpurea]|uniref:Uncharacterized protein n=1 Tax=Salix purpurea TaxID=77065 RepID=A0A9Q0WNT9_SALPP|nr:hypothetical protein OIU79_021376 [Salix purpurea]